MYVVFGILCAFRLLASAELIDAVYGQGLYPVTQAVLRVAFGWWPFPATILGIAVLVALLGRSLYRLVRGPGGFGYRFRKFGVGLTRALAVVATWFMLFWGINYGRPTVPKRLGLGPYARDAPDSVRRGARVLLETEELRVELSNSTTLVNRLRAEVSSTNGPHGRSFSVSDALDLGVLLRATLSDIGTDTVPQRRLRLLPAGTLLRFGTSGVYSPWSGDPHVDAGLHPLQLPFTATHELAHAQGVTDEGDCNLLAYLACIRSNDPFVLYSAELTYLRYLRSAVARRDRRLFDEHTSALSPAVAADIENIRIAMDRFEEIAPKARDLVYDSYLKTQGVQEGLASYGRIIDWVLAARRERPELFPAALEAGRGR